MRDAILAWYGVHGRALAFRGTTDPYAILVSEAMAQQTQAARAAEAWRRFLDEFPTFAALAAASPAAVLRAWRGLGYNRRALALRRAAVEVMVRHDGILPGDLAELERLPGIGPYTARAVAALAFGLPVGAVDTNVRRVLIRAVVGDARAWGGLSGAGAGAEPTTSGGAEPTTSGGAEPTELAELAVPSPRDLQALADASVPADRPGLWTHAVMDVGAVFCRPRNPRCDDCPAMAWCRTAALRPAAGARARESRQVGEVRAMFASTSRWLRGRILDQLRDGSDGDWVELAAPIGEHGLKAILAALAALDREGLAQRHPSRPGLARLPLA